MQTHAGADPFGIVGQVLDAQFRVDRLVGEGGFSAVYRGHHIGLDEPIAIKCLKLPPSLSPPLVDQFAKRFRDESRILYRLSQGNLNIVRSMAGGTWPAPTGLLVPFMILEWMEGRSLANEFTIRRTVGNQGRSLADVVKLFGSAADGLGYAHSQGVVHRDLNPGNLFLAATPQGTKMKVLDFGVAKILDDATLNIGPRTQTVGQIRIFAPAYGAPEQFDDTLGTVGAASDVYAFALILLEAMRDRSVNDGAHLGEFAQKAIDPLRRPTPRTLGVDVPDEVEQIFVRATKLDPRERWQSAGELWQALAIATNAASQQRHAQAALETPALNMPVPGSRSTQTGMGAPPQPQKTQGTHRMDKTMPIGAMMPKLKVPTPQRVPLPPSSARLPAAPATSPRSMEDAPPTFGEPEDDDIPTQVGARAAMMQGNPGIPQNQGTPSELEDEVTRVRAPDVDVLRGLAEADARRAAMAQSSPRPAAGSPMQGPSPEHTPPPYGAGGAGGAATMMMQPGGYPPAQPPPRQAGLAATMPLTGPHPLGMAMPPSGGGPLPAAGVPSQQGYPPPQQPPQQQYPQHPPPQQQQYPQHPQQPPMMQHGQMPQHAQTPAYGQPQLGESASMPPGSIAGVPSKSSSMLFVMIGLGAMALIGVIGITIFLVSGKKDDTGTAGSASVPSASIPLPVASTPTPTPAPTPEPTPPPAETAATADTVDAAAEAPSTPTPPATDVSPPPTPQPAPLPAPGPAPGPAPAPLPVPVAVKDAGAAADPNAFNESMARSRLGQANSVLVFCNKSGQTGSGTASVTFNPDGSVGGVSMDPPFAGTPGGDCVAGQFKRAKVTAFQGSPRTIKHSFEVPK